MNKSDVERRRILVVDNDPAIGQLCLRVLTSEGFSVDIAVNGIEARDMIREKKYDLILIEIKIPIMNGMELYQYMIREHPDLANRVIFTDGEVMVGDTQAFLKRSRRPFLPKAFTPDELKAIIKQTLRELEK